jgi:hypothetical protein
MGSAAPGIGRCCLFAKLIPDEVAVTDEQFKELRAAQLAQITLLESIAANVAVLTAPQAIAVQPHLGRAQEFLKQARTVIASLHDR